MEERLKTGVIIVAGGSGRRMGGAIPKQFRIVGGMPLLARTIATFSEALPSARMVVVLPEQYTAFWRDLSARFNVPPHMVAAGGSERFHSVKAGIDALGEGVNLIAVHDGVRALCSKKLIIRALQCAIEHGSAVPCITPVDSLREVQPDGSSHITDRSRLRIVQTPQIFDAALLRRAYDSDFDPSFTDDASVVEHCGTAVMLCEGERMNIKITTPEDIITAEALLAAGEETKNENLRI